MKKLILLFLLLISGQSIIAVNWGMWDATRSYVVFNVKSSSETYSLWNSGVGNFQSHNFGTFNSNETFTITAFDVKTWKSDGGNVTGCEYYYIVYRTGERPISPSFASLGGGWIEDLGSGNQKWGGSGLSVNLLSGLISGGNYTLEIYGRVSGTGDPNGNLYDNNNGNSSNYTATFTFRKVIISNNDGNWSDAGKWDNGAVPNVFDEVTINHSINVDIAGECYNLNVNSTKSISIHSSKSLTVSGTLTNSAGNTGLVVQSGGSLIQSSASVAATVEREINGWSDAAHGWHYLASPVASQAISSGFTASTNDYDFFAWWEPTNVWVNYKNTSVAPTWSTANVLGGTSGADNFIPGKGYLVAYAATSTKQFTGTLNKDDVAVINLPISAGTNSGWHLLGNPFSSALTWGTGWALTNINSTAKIWKESSASWIDLASGSGIIPALNGFMVQVTATFGGNNSLTIPAAARLHNTTPWYKSASGPVIKLVANDPAGLTAQESVIRFMPDATPVFDPAYDCRFMAGYAPEFYSVAGDEHLSTNALPEAGGVAQVPFDFIRNNGSNFTIEAETISGIVGPVILTDLQTGNTQDLASDPVYAFTSATGDPQARFLLSFGQVGVGETVSDNPWKVYASGSSLTVLSKTNNQGDVFVYNLLGQLITRQKLSAGNITRLELATPPGYYLVKVVSGTQTFTGKVFIN